MCLKVSFSKVIFRSLNLLSQNAETAAVEVMDPLAACEEDQRYLVSSPVMGGVLSCFLLPWSRMLIFCSIYCAIEFNFFFLTK